ncbi:UBN2_3 domain-containing protein, partial [Cephalotus follicularis]
DFNDPLYLHSSDTLEVNLVNEQLIGNENYGVWSRAMLIALTAKNKQGSVTGSCKKPKPESTNLHQWERCNAIVLSWIMNSVSKEIFNDEFDSLITLTSYGCDTSKAYKEHSQQQKLLHFLMGLNDSYGHIRSQILLMSTLPTIGEAYSLISQEESHRR